MVTILRFRYLQLLFNLKFRLANICTTNQKSLVQCVILERKFYIESVTDLQCSEFIQPHACVNSAWYLTKDQSGPLPWITV